MFSNDDARFPFPWKRCLKLRLQTQNLIYVWFIARFWGACTREKATQREKKRNRAARKYARRRWFDYEIAMREEDSRNSSKVRPSLFRLTDGDTVLIVSRDQRSVIQMDR